MPRLNLAELPGGGGYGHSKGLLSYKCPNKSSQVTPTLSRPDCQLSVSVAWVLFSNISFLYYFASVVPSTLPLPISSIYPVSLSVSLFVSHIPALVLFYFLMCSTFCLLSCVHVYFLFNSIPCFWAVFSISCRISPVLLIFYFNSRSLLFPFYVLYLFPFTCFLVVSVLCLANYTNYLFKSFHAILGLVTYHYS